MRTDVAWLDKNVEELKVLIDSTEQFPSLDLTSITDINLFEWLTVVSMIDEIFLRDNIFVKEFSFQILPNGKELHSLNEIKEYEKIIKQNSSYHNEELDHSRRAYRVAGFLESIETVGVLRSVRSPRIQYSYISLKKANARTYYKSNNERETVLFGLTRINTNNNKEDCRQFLDKSRILNWKQTMEQKYSQSALFSSDEVWRIFCYELAVNVWEHSSSPGFLSTRIVEPYNKYNKLKSWCENTYPDYIHPLFFQMKDGFLELCISDAGEGIVSTLRNSFEEKNHKSNYSDIDILKFAFSENGTCKKGDESWAIERHALSRILNLVAKYGGALTVRSGRGEIAYVGDGGKFSKISGENGYEPNFSRITDHDGYLGTHIQLLLPLSPKINFNNKNLLQRQRTLINTLPNTFGLQTNFPIGHLVPLRESLKLESGTNFQPEKASIGNDLKLFKTSCIKLGKKLLRRSKNEPLVLDFSDLNWTPAQLETLFFLLENVLQNRPVLLVELSPELAKGCLRLEKELEPTQLDQTIADETPGHAGHSFGEVTENTFFETYSSVHETVLGVDKDGIPYIFGLPQAEGEYEEALLSIIKKPSTIASLSKDFKVEEKWLNKIINNTNPLFSIDNKGCISTVWSSQSIKTESQRVMSKHFSTVIDKSNSWRGRSSKEKNMIFHLPWDGEWVEEFFECGRILSRERYVDEAAQRLIYRLEIGLQNIEINKTLNDIKMLACATAPSLTLATAIQRWWPTPDKPIVADLGQYLMINPKLKIPKLISDGEIVIVQDVLNKHHLSHDLIKKISSYKKPLCLLSFTELKNGIKEPEVTDINGPWRKGDDDIYQHAMIKLPRPVSCSPPKNSPYADKNAYWVEPRTLRPFKYSTLKGSKSHKTNTKRLKYIFEKAADQENYSLIRSGHYAYDLRHYNSTLDISGAINGSIGDEVAHWLASICIGEEGRSQPNWESQISYSLKGDVTAVLLPMHSHVRHLWPKVENLLAQRDRRQPFWFLDATLFMGHGPVYRLPIQLEQLIKDSQSNKTKIRLLILDDASVTSRTLQTILRAIDRGAYSALNKKHNETGVNPSPIEWIRYFSIFNQLSTAQNDTWGNIKTSGEYNIPFNFSYFLKVYGFPVYEEKSCPNCKDLSRIKRLKDKSIRIGSRNAEIWAKNTTYKLRPKSIDSHSFKSYSYTKLPKVITIANDHSTKQLFESNYSDYAISRFYDLMYKSYPITNILESLDQNQPLAVFSKQVAQEYDQYRWAVLQWCMRHWHRVKAFAGQSCFFNSVRNEIKNNSTIIPSLLEAISSLHYMPEVKALITTCLFQLYNLEQIKLSYNYNYDKDKLTVDNAEQLDLGLNLFLMNLSRNDIKKYKIPIDENNNSPKKPLLKTINKVAKQIDSYEINILRNIYNNFSRYTSQLNSGENLEWALKAIAENLFRGVNPDNTVEDDHHLLRYLIKSIQREPERTDIRNNLSSSLSHFVSAIKNITIVHQLKDSEIIVAEAQKVLSWLRKSSNEEGFDSTPPDLKYLDSDISLEGNFVQDFNTSFTKTVEQISKSMDGRYKSKLKVREEYKRLKFLCTFDKECKKIKVMTFLPYLEDTIANLSMDPIKNEENKDTFKAYINITKSSDSSYLHFVIYTDYKEASKTQEIISKKQKTNNAFRNLNRYGVIANNIWEQPDIEGKYKNFLAKTTIKVPTNLFGEN